MTNKENVKKSPLYLCLMHWPVKNNRGIESASAVTNFDIHDFARLCRTYNVGQFFIIHPIKEQRDFADKIVSHWRAGAGAAMNPDRAEAHSIVNIVTDLEAARSEVQKRHPASNVAVVATKSAKMDDDVSFNQLRARIAENQDAILLCLGTAWGFTDSFLAAADIRLAPIQPDAEYLHLSVRTAGAILLDRILGDR